MPAVPSSAAASTSASGTIPVCSPALPRRRACAAPLRKPCSSRRTSRAAPINTWRMRRSRRRTQAYGMRFMHGHARGPPVARSSCSRSLAAVGGRIRERARHCPPPAAVRGILLRPRTRGQLTPGGARQLPLRPRPAPRKRPCRCSAAPALRQRAAHRAHMSRVQPGARGRRVLHGTGPGLHAACTRPRRPGVSQESPSHPHGSAPRQVGTVERKQAVGGRGCERERCVKAVSNKRQICTIAAATATPRRRPAKGAIPGDCVNR